jgi:hypothetical protein
LGTRRSGLPDRYSRVEQAMEKYRDGVTDRPVRHRAHYRVAPLVRR